MNYLNIQTLPNKQVLFSIKFNKLLLLLVEPCVHCKDYFPMALIKASVQVQVQHII